MLLHAHDRANSGCAKGSFLMSMAERHQDQNFLGLEIRRPVTAMAFARAAKLETKNCHFVCCNANVRDVESKFVSSFIGCCLCTSSSNICTLVLHRPNSPRPIFREAT